MLPVHAVGQPDAESPAVLDVRRDHVLRQKPLWLAILSQDSLGSCLCGLTHRKPPLLRRSVLQQDARQTRYRIGMDESTAVQYILPTTLALIMLSLGLSLRTADFRAVLSRPQSMAVGLLGQLASACSSCASRSRAPLGSRLRVAST